MLGAVGINPKVIDEDQPIMTHLITESYLQRQLLGLMVDTLTIVTRLRSM